MRARCQNQLTVECALFRVMLPFESVTNLVVTEEPKKLQHWERQSADPLVSTNMWSCEARLHSDYKQIYELQVG